MGSAKRIFGGLLTGAGEGLLEKARAERREALFRLREGAITERATERERRADERAGKAHERSRELLTSVVTGEGGDLVGITRGGDTKPLDLKAGKKPGDSGLSVGDKRDLDAAIERHTTGKDSFEGEQTDWDAVAKRLRTIGREDLARRVESVEAPASSRTGVESPDYIEAKKQAEKWASDQAGFWSPDSKDFKDFGGNRTEAIQAKTMEFYRHLTGAQQPADGARVETGEAAVGGGSRGATGDQGATTAAAGAPQGSGTRSDPYRPTTQAEYDALPSGAIFINPSDGKTYRK